LQGADGDAETWSRAASLAQRLGDPGRAAAIWEAGWRRGVLAGAEDLHQRIRLHLAGGTPARAAELLTTALEEQALPDDLEHRRLLARAWQAARDHDEALAAWRDVAERSGAGDDWLRLGELAYGWGEWDIAGEALAKARDLGEPEAEEWLSSLPEQEGGEVTGGTEKGGPADEA
ncbi:tetratricopeptide repeat protein, partial [Halomonas salina]|uniref:tetratricopeptide repeat protein n=1 Tax=Halomonas salina TaxID=42565 RepID=UPI0005568410